MDDELNQLETELRNLRPAAPSPKLAARLQRELAAAAPAMAALEKPTRPQFRAAGWWWVALPAAAAGLLVFNIKLRESAAGGAARSPIANPVAASAAADGEFKPVTAQNLLYAADYEGLVTLDDGTPARRERLHFVDTITWRNQRTNASLTWSVPREEVRIVPVRFQ